MQLQKIVNYPLDFCLWAAYRTSGLFKSCRSIVWYWTFIQTNRKCHAFFHFISKWIDPLKYVLAKRVRVRPIPFNLHMKIYFFFFCFCWFVDVNFFVWKKKQIRLSISYVHILLSNSYFWTAYYSKFEKCSHELESNWTHTRKCFI